MRISRNKLLVPSVLMIGVGLAGPAWSACIPPEAQKWNGTPVNGMYTDVDGKVEGCPAGYLNLCEITKDASSCVMDSFATDGTPVKVEVTRDPVTFKYTAECVFGVEDPPDSDNYTFSGDPEDCANVALFDFASTKGAQGANACIYSFDQDAASFFAGFDGANFFGASL